MPQPLLDLKTKLQAIHDPHTGRAKRHHLLDILLISLCASLCGAQTFTDIALWGRCQHDWLKTWLALPHGIPSHDTFNRLFGLIDPNHFREVFIAWTQSLRRAVADEVVAVVESERTVRGQVQTQRRYYLTSLTADAVRLAGAVRGHWEVENSVHWVLDVQLGEDAHGLR